MKSHELAAALRRLLDGGRYPVNSRLPAERVLAQQLGTSRGLLRVGLAQLEAEGRIWRNVGQGTFVGGRPIKTNADLSVISEITNPLEVIEVRSVIEPQTAWYAAIRSSEDDLRHIRNCLTKIDGSPNHTNYGRWDSTFHRAIAEAAHNALLLAIFDAVNEVRNQPAWTKIWMPAVPARREFLRRQHLAIVQAIERRNAEAARDATFEHIRTIGEFFQPRISEK
jgi:DNA-binding FadR family transcriptional regulator